MHAVKTFLWNCGICGRQHKKHILKTNLNSEIFL